MVAEGSHKFSMSQSDDDDEGTRGGEDGDDDEGEDKSLSQTPYSDTIGYILSLYLLCALVPCVKRLSSLENL